MRVRHGYPGRSGERANQQFQDVLGATVCLSASVLRSAEPDIHLQSRAPKSLHRRLSLCSLPVPKQFVESLGRVISVAQSAICRTWQSAHFVHPVSYGSILCCRSPALFGRHEVSLLPIHGKQIRDHLPRYGKCRPIAISFLPFLVRNHSHFVVLSRCQHRLVGRVPFISAEAAVADGLLDRAEARDIPDL
jgi:hypothetical protein